MRESTVRRAVSVSLVLLLGSALAACAAAPPSPIVQQGASSEVSAEGSASQPEGSGEYAFGVDRDEIATSIEAAFANKNGDARWEGDTLVLRLDGDAATPMAGFTECRVLLELLLEDDVSVIEYPNGQVACADVLAN